MIKAIIIEDEVHSLDTLSILIGDYCPEVKLVEKCSSGKQGIIAVEQHKPELVFLDIEMPLMNGFEFLEQFPKISFSVIFTTSYDKYAIKAIKVSALDYLLKPINAKELISAVKKVQMQKHSPVTEQYEMLLNEIKNRNGGFNKIAIPTIEGFELIRIDQIMHCEADDNYTYIYLKNKTNIIACRTLKEIQEQLENFSSFLRVHHSYLVNMNEVAKYVKGDGGYLIMNDGYKVNVSRSHKDLLMRKLH